MNINILNQLIPSQYRSINVAETILYFRDGAVYPITSEYIVKENDFIFKYSKTNGVVSIEEMDYLDIPQIKYTPEEWVKKYFTNLEIIALMRLEQNILSQNKNLGLKMVTIKNWLEQMMIAQPSSNFTPAPYSYLEISNEASSILSSQV